MDIKKLAVFSAVAETLSFTKAAEMTGYTQSGVSHIIQSLEEEAGFQLFARSTRRIVPTENARMMLPAVRSLLQWNEQLEQTISAIQGVHGGTLRIAAFTSVSVHWLPPILKAYSADYPNVRVQLMEGGAQEIEAWVDEGVVDMGFFSRFTQPDDRWIPLGSDELLAVLPLDHPLAAQRSCTLAQLAQEEFIMYAAGVDTDIRRAMAQQGLQPNAGYSSMGDHTILSMAENGLGVTILPELMVRGYAHNVALRPLDPPIKRTLGVLLPPQGTLSPAAAAFLELVRSATLE